MESYYKDTLGIHPWMCFASGIGTSCGRSRGEAIEKVKAKINDENKPVVKDSYRMPFDTTKEQLKHFKTAYSPLYGVDVQIDSIYDDDLDRAVLTCSSDYKEGVKLDQHLFRANELIKYRI